MKQVLTSLFLVIIAVGIFIILFIPAAIWQIVHYFKNKENPAYINDLLFSTAQCIDELGGVMYRQMFSDILFTKTGTRMNSAHHTISYFIGINKQSNTLTKAGVLLYKILNLIQPNHCEQAVVDNA